MGMFYDHSETKTQHIYHTRSNKLLNLIMATALAVFFYIAYFYPDKWIGFFGRILFTIAIFATGYESILIWVKMSRSNRFETRKEKDGTWSTIIDKKK